MLSLVLKHPDVMSCSFIDKLYQIIDDMGTYICTKQLETNVVVGIYNVCP